MSHKDEKNSLLFYLADRLGGPLVSATLVACLISGLETSHLFLYAAGITLLTVSYIHNKRHH